jgi:insulysin
MSYIKSRGWASGLGAGVWPVCPGTPGIFKCQIRLTEDGLANYQEIVKIVFQYISLLKESPPALWIFEEQKSLADIEFKFRQKTPARKFSSKIAAVMQTPLPREWIISGLSKYVHSKFITACIYQLTTYTDCEHSTRIESRKV